jgi:hypothetical protein
MHLLVLQTSQVKHYQIRYCVLYCRVVCGDITSCSPLKANRSFRGTCRLHLHGLRIRRARNQSVKQVASRALVSFSDYSLILEMEAKYFDETSIDFHRPTQCYIPKDRTLHNHCCENAKSYATYYIVMYMLTDAAVRNTSVKFYFCSFTSNYYYFLNKRLRCAATTGLEGSDIEITVSNQILTNLRFHKTECSIIWVSGNWAWG